MKRTEEKARQNETAAGNTYANFAEPFKKPRERGQTRGKTYQHRAAATAAGQVDMKHATRAYKPRRRAHIKTLFLYE